MFDSFRDGNFELYVTNVDGTVLLRLTNSATHETSGRWSPDGTQVVFTNNEDPDTASIYIVNADGTGLKPLVNKWREELCLGLENHSLSASGFNPMDALRHECQKR